MNNSKFPYLFASMSLLFSGAHALTLFYLVVPTAELWLSALVLVLPGLLWMACVKGSFRRAGEWAALWACVTFIHPMVVFLCLVIGQTWVLITYTRTVGERVSPIFRWEKPATNPPLGWECRAGK